MRFLLDLFTRWRFRDRTVSDRWLADQERREFGSGIESVCWSWPVKKD